jgi:hypothetical protein
MVPMLMGTGLLGREYIFPAMTQKWYIIPDTRRAHLLMGALALERIRVGRSLAHLL